MPAGYQEQKTARTATISMGFDHRRLTFRHSGRDFRRTDVHGDVVHDIVS
ncbi:MAG TPA: hypothetical protein DCG12_24485 [Planctomycetaceae bacterium]|nr:hypothetical protein [Planctomycetaceae bacterium]